MNDDLPSIASDQSRQLERLAGDWATVEQRGDTTFLERNLADDFVGVEPYGFLLTKDDWLEQHKSRKLRYESFRLDQVWVRFYGEAAVMIARQIMKGKYEDNDLPGSLRATLFFAQQEGRWLLARSLTGLYTRDPEVLGAVYVAAGLFGGVFLVPVSMGTLVTGVLLSFGTPWGLVRHYWVLVKLVLTVALVASGILVLNRIPQEAAVRASEVPLSTLTSAEVGALRFQIIAAVSVALLLLVAATTLSVYKPWGKTRFGRRKVLAEER